MVITLNIQRLNIELMREKITMKELAERAHISRPNLSSIYTRGTCSPRSAGKIAAALGIEPEELIA